LLVISQNQEAKRKKQAEIQLEKQAEVQELQAQIEYLRQQEEKRREEWEKREAMI